MKKIVLLFAALFAGVTANAATVYFENTGNWPAVCAHMWGGTGGDTTWPGKNITQQTIQATNGKTYYYVDTTNASIIFDNNNQGAQTKDLTVADGAVFSFAKNGKDVAGATIDPIGTIAKSGNDYVFTAAGDVVLTPGYLYFPVSTYNYSVAYLYTWEPYITADWPGDQLTKTTIDGVEFWKWETNDVRDIEGKTITGVQLNGGGNDNKLEAFGVAVNNNYYININNGQSGPVADWEESDTPADYSSLTVKIGYAGNGWNLGDGGVQPVDGIATFDNIELGADGYFKFCVWNEKTQTNSYYNSSSPIALNTWAALTYNATEPYESAKLNGAKAGVGYTIKFDCSNNSVYVSEGGDVVVTYPETMYVIGTVDGNDWDPSKGVSMTKTADGVFTAQFVLAPAKDDETPGFSFTSQLGSDSNDWTGISPYRYGTGGFGNNTQISAGGDYPCSQNGDPGSYQMSGNNTISVVVDLTKSRLYVNAVTGVESVMVDANAPVEYFNLQGVRVANPENGVFIRVQNGKATKVVK